MTLSPLPDLAGPGLLIGLGFTLLALALMFGLIVIVESTALQLMRWAPFKRSLLAALWMNLASTLIGFFFLALIPRFGLAGLAVAWALSVAIEAVVLMRMKPGRRPHNWAVALVANLASYLLLLLPTYYFSQ